MSFSSIFVRYTLRVSCVAVLLGLLADAAVIVGAGILWIVVATFVHIFTALDRPIN